MEENDKIESFKGNFKNIKPSEMGNSIYANYNNEFRNILESIKRQDKADERYILNKRIIPVLSGLIILTVVLMFNVVSNILILIGSLMIYTGLITILLLFFKDYKNISTEQFGISLNEFLENKKRQLAKWKYQPFLYHVIYAVFVIGVLFLIIGNTGLLDVLKTKLAVAIYVICIILALIFSGLIGEYLYRNRYRKQHHILKANISDLLNQLNSEAENNIDTKK